MDLDLAIECILGFGFGVLLVQTWIQYTEIRALKTAQERLWDSLADLIEQIDRRFGLEGFEELHRPVQDGDEDDE